MNIKKQESRQAIPPTPPPLFIQEMLKKEKEGIQDTPKDYDETIAKGVDSEFWGLVKRFIEKKQRRIKESIKSEIQKTGYGNMEDIGLKYLMFDWVNDNLQDIIDYVENTAKKVEEVKKEEQEKEARKVVKQHAV